MIWMNLMAMSNNFCPLAPMAHLGSLGKLLSSMWKIMTQWLQSAINTEGEGTQAASLRFGTG